jgi:hypothetical protein
MQWAHGLAGRQSSIRRNGRGAGFVGQHTHDRIDRRIHGIDASQMCVHHFQRTQLALCDELGQLGR